MTGRPRRSVMAIAVACFFLSGVAGLLYEVVWTRLLGVVFGHTVHAITTVLAAYMGGLALGAVLVGRRADRLVRPLRAYGILEAGIGLWCALTPLLFAGADRAYLWAHHLLDPSPAGATALHLALAALLLLPPTTLMGATLPVLSRAVVREHAAAASQVGTLYAVNTWGAVVGTAATGFLLLPLLGLGATVWIGVALNGLVALLAIAADRARAPEAAAGASVPPPAGEASAAGRRAHAPLDRTALTVALVAIGISGAASMAYQVSWTRALSLVLGSSTYAFSAMLTTFLVGLALGAVLVARALRRRTAELWVFGAVEIAIALVTVALLPALGRLPDAVLAVLGSTGVTSGTVLATQFFLSFAVMILPTLLIGATFPLVLAAIERGVDRLGRDVGLAYGANTVGTIAGSIAAGFFLIRASGIQNTVVVAGAANLLAGVAVVAVARGVAPRWKVGAGVAVAVFAAVAGLTPHWDPMTMTSGVGVYAKTYLANPDALRAERVGRELLFYDEGISTTVSVARDPGGTVLTVNGKADASNDADMPTQLLCTHLGMLLHERPERVLIVGLASGVSVGAATLHPAKTIDVAELEPAMVEASRFFLAENRDPLADPRVRVIEGDGRSILATARAPYDVVISEPSNPWIAGIAGLFTVDFYRAARDRLAPGGVFVQWLQNYSIRSEDMRMVVRTFQEVFPHVSVWLAGGNDLLLVATPGPVTLDLGLVERRLAASPALREDLSTYGWLGENLAFRFVLGEEDARRYAAGAPLNTDDLPLLEFSAPRSLYASDPEGNAAALRAARTIELPALRGLDPARYVGALGAARAAQNMWFSGHLAEARHRLARAEGDPAPEVALARARVRFVLGDLAGAERELAAGAAALAGDPGAARIAHALRVLEEPRPAARFAAAVAASGGVAQRHAELLRLAEDQLRASIAVSPGAYTTWFNLGMTLRALGDGAGARAALQRAAALQPGAAEPRAALAALQGAPTGAGFSPSP